MTRIILAALAVTVAAGSAIAQEAPYTVRNGQVLYPGQQQWRAPVYDSYAYEPYAPSYFYGDPYRGGAYAAFRPRDYGTRFYGEPGYAYSAPGIYVFDGKNVNQDQNYSGR